ncbi:MAG: ATP-binding protein, partial [Bacteroidota bacterium]
YTVYKASQQRKQYAQVLEKEVENRTEDLQRANRRQQQLNYELKTFSFIASHDIKEPIRGIGAQSGLIYAKIPEGLKADLAPSFQVIQNSTRQLYKLVEDFTRYTAMSQNEAVKPESVDLNQLVTTIIETFAEGLRQYRGKILMSQLPTITSNSSLLFTSIKNLIENGLKFNKSKVPTVEVSYHPQANHQEIIVSDNGIGIDPAYHDEIFGMFKRLHMQGEYEGSGIGLAIVRLSVRKLDGDIRVESQPGEGSKFIISLPLV